MNEERIIQALNQYQGTQESLNQTVAVLSEELGENWTDEVFQKLGGLSVELKEKLDHVFNYYAASAAWQETQSYLAQEEPLSEEVRERLPVLKHWLNFFGDSGHDLYQQLETKISSKGNDSIKEDEALEPADSETKELEAVQENPSEGLLNEIKEDAVSETQFQDNDKEVISEEELKPEEEPEQEKTDSTIVSDEKKGEIPSYDKNSPDFFAFQKAQKEIDLLNAVQAWLSARCLQLNNMEVFVYPYYGFAVDLMRQTVKDIQTVLDLEDKTFVNMYPQGEEGLLRKKEAIEADIKMAVENCESATTALIDENMDMDKVRKTLGDLDQSTEPEYLGPAPDGFELLDEGNDQPLDETAVKEQYQQLEKEVSKEQQGNDILPQEKKTSQKSQNSVQKKLSFSFKPKKSGG